MPAESVIEKQGTLYSDDVIHMTYPLFFFLFFFFFFRLDREVKAFCYRPTLLLWLRLPIEAIDMIEVFGSYEKITKYSLLS